MKNLVLLLALFGAQEVMAVCSSQITRTNSSANSVLTSTKYNTDLNTVYTRANDLPGDCLQAGTVGSAKLTTSEFEVLFNGIHEGCRGTYSSASAVLIERCIMSLNNNFVRKETTTSVSMGCSGCTAETSSTTFYVYVKSDSASSTINPLLLTGAPNSDGFDSSDNKVVARIYNDASSNINQYLVEYWDGQNFSPKDGIVSALVTDNAASGDVTLEQNDNGTVDWISGNCPETVTGRYICTFTSAFFYTVPRCWVFPESTSSGFQFAILASSLTKDQLTVEVRDSGFALSSVGAFSLHCRVPKPW